MTHGTTYGDGTLGDANLDAQAVQAGLATMPMGRTDRFETKSGDEVFVVGYTAPPTLLLIGGGHVNLATARIAETLGFRVMVADDREEFANAERFPMAEQLHVGPYATAIAQFDVTPNMAIVVASRGHQFDDVMNRDRPATSSASSAVSRQMSSSLSQLYSLLP